jgi:CBS-domain-containing membrane protein
VVTCKATTSAGQVIRSMLDSGVARVWCVDEKGSIVGVISQSDIIGAIVRVHPTAPTV